MLWFKSTVALAAILVATADLPRHALGPRGRRGRSRGADRRAATRPREISRRPWSADGFDAEPLLAAEALDAIVAPVALYPDALLAQVLVAATYPLQVVKAGRLLEESEGLSDDELTERISAEDWDPSILVLLSGFPTVVERMADDLDWTEALGNAMLAQDDDVLAAVQRMREQALDTGYLTSNAAQVVEEDDAQIYIRPADPEVVYVPNYDPAMAFTSAPTASPYIAPPRSGFANPLVAGAIAFGAALLIQELFADDDSDDGWDDYWEDRRPIDWRDRQFYPRPHGHWRGDRDDYAWSRERDAYWDHRRDSWRYDEAARERHARHRRDAIAWIDHPSAAPVRLGTLRQAALAHEADAERALAQRRAAAREQAADRARPPAAAKERVSAAARKRQAERARAAAEERRQQDADRTRAAARRESRHALSGNQRRPAFPPANATNRRPAPRRSGGRLERLPANERAGGPRRAGAAEGSSVREEDEQKAAQEQQQARAAAREPDEPKARARRSNRRPEPLCVNGTSRRPAPRRSSRKPAPLPVSGTNRKPGPRRSSREPAPLPASGTNRRPGPRRSSRRPEPPVSGRNRRPGRRGSNRRPRRRPVNGTNRGHGPHSSVSVPKLPATASSGRPRRLRGRQKARAAAWSGSRPGRSPRAGRATAAERERRQPAQPSGKGRSARPRRRPGAGRIAAGRAGRECRRNN